MLQIPTNLVDEAYGPFVHFQPVAVVMSVYRCSAFLLFVAPGPLSNPGLCRHVHES